MQIPQIRVGDFFKHEEGYSRVDKILNLDILPQDDPHDPRTHDNDAFYVEVILDWLDLWLPDKEMWTAKHAKHLQMSEFQHFTVFAGTRAECEAVVQQIVSDDMIAKLEEAHRREREALEIEVVSLKAQIVEIMERKFGKELPTKEEARRNPNMVLKKANAE